MKWLRRLFGKKPEPPKRRGMWDHLAPEDLLRVAGGLCDCDSLNWSSSAPRWHDPELCAKWREMMVSPDAARELGEWFDLGERPAA